MDEFERLEPQFSGPKRHHYVSVFYLEGFTDGGHLQVFDRKTGEIRRQSPKDTTVKGNFYTFIDKNEQKRFDLEKFFSIIEGRASSALRAIEKGKSPSHEEREYLALFIAMTAIRTPAALEESRHVKQEMLRAEMRLRMATQQQAYLQVKKAPPLGATEEELQTLATDLFETVNENRFTVEASDELAREASLKLWTPVAQTIFDRDWTVVEALGDAEYLTSDSPAVLVPLERFKDEPTGFGSLHAHLLFPLSRKYALVMNGDGGRFRKRKASAAQVQEFNLRLAADCYRFLIGTRVKTLEGVISKLDLVGTQWSPRMSVDIATHPKTGKQGIRLTARGQRNGATDSSPTDATKS